MYVSPSSNEVMMLIDRIHFRFLQLFSIWHRLPLILPHASSAENHLTYEHRKQGCIIHPVMMTYISYPGTPIFHRYQRCPWEIEGKPEDEEDGNDQVSGLL